MAKDAEVYLYPEMKKGVTSALAHARTDDSGNFRLNISNARIAHAVDTSSNGGWHTFTAITSVDGNLGVFTFSRKKVGGRWVDYRGKLSADLPVDLTANIPIRKPKPGTRAADLYAKAHSASSNPTDLLATTQITYSNVPTTFARVQSAWNLRATVTYGRTADTELDVGIQGSDPDGTWELGGSKHIGNSRGGSVSGEVTNNNARYYKTGFDWDLSYRCVLGACYWQLTPTAWTGALWSSATDWYYPYTDHEIGYYAPQNFGVDGVTKSTGENARYTGAAYVAGFSVGASSGYSSNVKIQWTEISRPTHYTYFFNGNSSGNAWWPQAREVFVVTGKG